jgi:hypothetical protein
MTAAGDALGEAVDPGAAGDEAALLAAAGRCYRHAASWRPAWRSLMRAITLYRERGDGVNQARATLEAIGILSPIERRLALANDALAALAGRESYLEVRLLLGHLRLLPPDERSQAIGRIQELAERHGYADVAARLLAEQAFFSLNEGRHAEGAALARAAHEGLVAAGRVAEASNPLITWSAGLTDSVDLAVAAYEEAIAYARSVHTRYAEVVLSAGLAGLHFLRGDLAAFDMSIEEIVGDTYLAGLLQAGRAEQAGDLQRALLLLPAPDEGGGFPPNEANIHAGSARIRSNAGDVAGARAELQAVLDATRLTPWRPPLTGGMLTFCFFDEYLTTFDGPLLRQVYEWAVSYRETRFLAVVGRGVDRMRGAMALQLGLFNQAETWYRAGHAWAERERCPVEAGRNLQGLAEVAERRGERDAAQGLRKRAAALFREQGAALYLKQVEASPSTRS